jgi:hypothetical protein
MSGVYKGIDMYRIGDMIITLNNLGREISEIDFEEGYKIKMLANELAKIGNRLNERETENE